MSKGVRSDLSNMILRQIKLKNRELYNATIKIQGLDEADLKSININGWEGLYNVKPKAVPEKVITEIVDDKLKGSANRTFQNADDRLAFKPSHRNVKNLPTFKSREEFLQYVKSLPQGEYKLFKELTAHKYMSVGEWKDALSSRGPSTEEILSENRKREWARIKSNRVNLEPIDVRLEAAKETFLGIPANTPTAKLTADQIDAIKLINEYGDDTLKANTV